MYERYLQMSTVFLDSSQLILSLPLHIGIEIHISDVLKINDRDFSITFSLYFNVQWREPRLQIDQNFFQNR